MNLGFLPAVQTTPTTKTQSPTGSQSGNGPLPNVPAISETTNLGGAPLLFADAIANLLRQGQPATVVATEAGTSPTVSTSGASTNGDATPVIVATQPLPSPSESAAPQDANPFQSGQTATDRPPVQGGQVADVASGPHSDVAIIPNPEASRLPFDSDSVRFKEKGPATPLSSELPTVAPNDGRHEGEHSVDQHAASALSQPFDRAASDTVRISNRLAAASPVSDGQSDNPRKRPQADVKPAVADRDDSKQKSSLTEQDAVAVGSGFDAAVPTFSLELPPVAARPVSGAVESVGTETRPSPPPFLVAAVTAELPPPPPGAEGLGTPVADQQPSSIPSRRKEVVAASQDETVLGASAAIPLTPHHATRSDQATSRQSDGPSQHRLAGNEPPAAEYAAADASKLANDRSGSPIHPAEDLEEVAGSDADSTSDETTASGGDALESRFQHSKTPRDPVHDERVESSDRTSLEDAPSGPGGVVDAGQLTSENRSADQPGEDVTPVASLPGSGREPSKTAPIDGSGGEQLRPIVSAAAGAGQDSSSQLDQPVEFNKATSFGEDASASEPPPPERIGEKTTPLGNEVAIDRVGTARTEAVRPASSGPRPGFQVVQDQIASALEQAIAQKPAPLRMTLDPPELGTLAIEVVERNGRIEVRIEAEVGETSRLLREHLEPLRELTVRTLERLSADAGGASAGGQGGVDVQIGSGKDDNAKRGSGSAADDTATADEIEPDESAGGDRPRRSESRIDLQV